MTLLEHYEEERNIGREEERERNMTALVDYLLATHSDWTKEKAAEEAKRVIAPDKDHRG